MHEAKLANQIISIVERDMKEASFDRPVETIVVDAGSLSPVNEHSLQFFFQNLKEQHAFFSKTTLILENSPLMVSCPKCNSLIELINPDFYCTGCQHPLDVISGNEMIIRSYTISDQ